MKTAPRISFPTRIEDIVLTRGQHPYRAAGMCAMEFYAFVAGERHSSAPECVCPVLRSAIIAVNDRGTDEDRQRLKDLTSVFIGTRASFRVMEQRALRLVDDMVRRRLEDYADFDRSLLRIPRYGEIGPITDEESALRANSLCVSFVLGHTSEALRQLFWYYQNRRKGLKADVFLQSAAQHSAERAVSGFGWNRENEMRGYFALLEECAAMNDGKPAPVPGIQLVRESDATRS